MAKGILQILRERNPLRNVRGAFNEKELAENATRSGLAKANKNIEAMRRTAELHRNKHRDD